MKYLIIVLCMFATTLAVAEEDSHNDEFPVVTRPIEIPFNRKINDGMLPGYQPGKGDPGAGNAFVLPPSSGKTRPVAKGTMYHKRDMHDDDASLVRVDTDENTCRNDTNLEIKTKEGGVSVLPGEIKNIDLGSSMQHGLIGTCGGFLPRVIALSGSPFNFVEVDRSSSSGRITFTFYRKQNLK